MVGVSFASTTVLTQFDIEEQVRNFLQKYRNIEVQDISVPKIKPVEGKIKTEIFERSKTPSYIYLTYKIYKNGTLYKTLSIPVKYRKVSYVVFSKTDIRKGEYITRDKVYLKKYAGRTNHMFTDLKEVIGQKARINIRKDTPLKEYMLVPDFLVLRGSNVKIIYNRGVIHIELLGKALENGKLNQIIKVRNISSGKVIPCKVIGRNQVLFIGGSF